MYDLDDLTSYFLPASACGPALLPVLLPAPPGSGCREARGSLCGGHLGVPRRLPRQRRPALLFLPTVGRVCPALLPWVLAALLPVVRDRTNAVVTYVMMMLMPSS